MDYPRGMDPAVQGLIIALSLRFTKRRPGLEQEDLLNEALIVYDRICKVYDPKEAKLSTVVYTAVRNQFLNIQNKYLIPSHEEVTEGHAAPIESLRGSLEQGLQYIQEHLIDPATVEVLDQLISKTTKKTTIKEICHELGISFFKYQQCEFKIRQLIKRMKEE